MTTHKDDKLTLPAIENTIFTNEKQKAYIYNATSIMGTLTHLAFILLFLHWDQTTLAWFNLLSVVCWLSTLWSNKKRNYSLSAAVIAIEIFSHAILATVTLGSDSGFQYYLWPVALLVMAVPTLPIITSTFIALMNLICFGLLSIFTQSTLPELASNYDFLFTSNLILAGGPFIIIAAAARFIYVNQYHTLSQIAERDDLTQLFNRRFGLRMLQHYFKNLEQSHQPFCIALVDVDNFKAINDELGHSIGDEVLIKIADYLSSTLRETDICSRWGGEEFLFILPNSNIELIQHRLERMCEDMPELITIENWQSPISCSFGLIQAKQEEPLEDAFKRVDSLLYKAKHNGRYQVVSDHSKSLTII